MRRFVEKAYPYQVVLISAHFTKPILESKLALLHVEHCAKHEIAVACTIIGSLIM